ncbi:unnamed protein product [Linum trigynum]|uniref:Uncharacterized protein n=1 Tax=Linum trigynum TaxID=586398 RepID=A0AAV2FX61_9ROSI
MSAGSLTLDEASPPVDSVVGQRRPPSPTSSPNPKGEKEAQQSKRRVRPTVAAFPEVVVSDEVREDADTATRDGAKPNIPRQRALLAGFLGIWHK